MKILHLPNRFLPWSTGGTEIYVLRLAIELQRLGVDSTFLIHQDTEGVIPAGLTNYQNFDVIVLPPIHDFKDRISFYSREVKEIAGFEETLRDLKPDIVHLHDFHGGSSLSHLLIAKKLGIRAIMTYHSPGQSCMQKSLRLNNHNLCDGKLILNRCTKCMFVTNGVREPLSSLFTAVGNWKKIRNDDSPLRRAMTARTAMKIFIKSFYEAVENLDRVHVHARWVEELYLINEVSPAKLFFARTAGPPAACFEKKDRKDITEEYPLKFLFAGRCERIKGIEVLIDAVLSLEKSLPLEVHFFAPLWTSSFAQEMLVKIDGDPRFFSPRLVKPDDMLFEMSQMDLLVVPSLWPETGPLTLLEAFAAGIPVIGTNSSGIAEWVNHGVNGLLFDYNDASNLAKMIRLIFEESGLLPTLTENIRVERTVSDLAHEIAGLYSEVLASRPS